MNLYFDASAIVALMTAETTASTLAVVVEKATNSTTSWLSVWEAATAVSRKTGMTATRELQSILTFCETGRIEILTENRPITEAALQAFDRYGRRSGHAAALNMGDCFSYAFAKSEGAKMLYAGNDFSQIDGV